MAMTRQKSLTQDNPLRVVKQTGDIQASGSSPLAHSDERKDLCAVAYPRLHSMQQTADFHFFDATLLLVLSGELHMQVGDTRHLLSNSTGICKVDPGLAANLSKFPVGDGQFRSIYLTISPIAITRFYQCYPEYAVTGRQSPQVVMLPTDGDLLTAFHQLRTDIESLHLSDARLALRVFDVLLALAERGERFTAQHNSSSERLKRILRDAPDVHWTAKSAGQALAMSEATLRRRLAEEGMRFDRVLLDVRMHHALMLLQTTSWTLLQIADACGYRSQARFSERFKARFGVSPARVR